jgi:hypothetical protein
MKVRFNVTKDERKALVKAVGEILCTKPKYMGAPSFAFEVGNCVIDKHGTIIFGDRIGEEKILSLLEQLKVWGYDFKEETEEQSGVFGRLSLNVSSADFTALSFQNLDNLISSKTWIIRKMTGADELNYEHNKIFLTFPWFKADATKAETEVYTQFINGLCKTAKEKQRISAAERLPEPGDNEKFKARCFLLSLGFIGEDYAQARKILLAPFTGNGSHKKGSG